MSKAASCSRHPQGRSRPSAAVEPAPPARTGLAAASASAPGPLSSQANSRPPLTCVGNIWMHARGDAVAVACALSSPICGMAVQRPAPSKRQPLREGGRGRVESRRRGMTVRAEGRTSSAADCENGLCVCCDRTGTALGPSTPLLLPKGHSALTGSCKPGCRPPRSAPRSEAPAGGGTWSLHCGWLWASGRRASYQLRCVRWRQTGTAPSPHHSSARRPEGSNPRQHGSPRGRSHNDSLVLRHPPLVSGRVVPHHVVLAKQGDGVGALLVHKSCVVDGPPASGVAWGVAWGRGKSERMHARAWKARGCMAPALVHVLPLPLQRRDGYSCSGPTTTTTHHCLVQG